MEVSAIRVGIIARSASDASGGLDDLVRLQAASADVNPAGARAVLNPDLLQVRVEAPPGGDHRVAARVPERGSLAAAEANLGHDALDGSGRQKLRETLADQRHPHHGDGGASALIALVPAQAGQRLVHRLAGDHPEGTRNPGRELDVLDAAGGLRADV